MSTQRLFSGISLPGFLFPHLSGSSQPMQPASPIQCARFRIKGLKVAFCKAFQKLSAYTQTRLRPYQHVSTDYRVPGLYGNTVAHHHNSGNLRTNVRAFLTLMN
ncbi:hypothetical protein [Cyclobacterium lianum]|uniref:hypothetical protein n=1 Tax=Cyclobacterium lianum TaxID=388280 RepID=UPI0011601A43|nr:hypothetical protein [Cyclobacterium lianum]